MSWVVFNIFFLFSHAKSNTTNNIRMGQVIYHIKALSVVFVPLSIKNRFGKLEFQNELMAFSACYDYDSEYDFLPKYEYCKSLHSKL